MQSRKLLTRLGIVFLAGLVAAYFLHFHWRIQIALYKNLLEKSGQKLTVGETLVPSNPDRNADSAFIEAVGLMPSMFFDQHPMLLLHFVEPGKAMVGSTQSKARLRSVDSSAEESHEWLEIDEALDDLHEATALIETLSRYSTLDFGTNRTDRYKLASVSRLLAASEMSALHRDEWERAASSLSTMLAIVRETREDTMLLGQSLRLLVSMDAFAGTWELLQRNEVPESLLAQVQHDWEAIDLIGSAAPTIAMTTATEEDDLLRYRTSSKEAARFGKSPGSEITIENLERRLKIMDWQFSGSYREEMNFLHMQQFLLEGARRFQASGFFPYSLQERQTELRRWHLDGRDERSFRLRSPLGRYSASDSYMSKLLQNEVARRLAITALAIERFKRRTGAAPIRLVELVPSLLKSIPQDPVDGKPMLYKITEHRFLLYSIGENGVDEGGDTSTTRSDIRAYYWWLGHDWVWPEAVR